MKIIFATQNSGKLKEAREIVEGSNVTIIGAREAGVTEGAREDGKTLVENALKKARFVAERTGEWAMSDDSGLSIRSLHDMPGVFTSRWAGGGLAGPKLAQFTLNMMKDIPARERDAVFQCVIALVSPNGQEWTFTGQIEGAIALKPVGRARPDLPYDTIFVPSGDSRTFAQLSMDEKNRISHRGRALEKFKEFVKNKKL